MKKEKIREDRKLKIGNLKMSYTKKVAEILGVEPDEEFEIFGFEGKVFKISETSESMCCLLTRHKDSNNWVLYASKQLMLLGLINGNYTIKKNTWKPELDEEYFLPIVAIDGSFNIAHYNWKGDIFDLAIWKAGLCYKTFDEAHNNGPKKVNALQEELEEAKYHD